jgi:hypothetical protein
MHRRKKGELQNQRTTTQVSQENQYVSRNQEQIKEPGDEYLFPYWDEYWDESNET